MVRAYRPRRVLESHTRYVIRMAIAILDGCVERRLTSDGDVTLLPSEALYPSMPTQRLADHRRREAVAASAYGIHHYENSWRSPLARLVNHGRAAVQQCFP
jgi:hypothetical protein